MKYLKSFEKLANEDPFITAARRGHTNNVKQRIKKNPTIVNIQDSYGETALMYAVLEKFPFVVDELIDGKADVNIQNNDGITALFLTTTLTIINKLLNAGADVNIKNKEGDTAIMKYAKLMFNPDPETYINIIELFLEYGLNISIKNNEGKNLYYILMDKRENDHHNIKEKFVSDVEKYLNINFPQFKEEYELNKDIKKFNI